MRNSRFLLLAVFFLLSAHCVFSEDRFEWTLDQNYTGAHQSTYDKLRWDIPNFMRQSTIDVAVLTGLNFQEGWASPMTVGFVDSAPLGVENVLAYVQFQSDGEKFWQTLNINVAAYEMEPFNFQKVFKHELLHAMLNDAAGPDVVPHIPIWFHEGLAVYGSEQGEQMLKSYVVQYEHQPNDFLINGLDGSHGGLDYAEDYLAFDYIRQEHGVTGLHNFVREVVSRKGDIPSAYEYACSESWSMFLTNYRQHAIERIKSIKREPRFRGPADKPY